MKKKIIIFTNNERSINVIKSLLRKHQVILIVVSKKFLTKDLVNKISNFNIKTIYFENYIKSLKKRFYLNHQILLFAVDFPKKFPKK